MAYGNNNNIERLLDLRASEQTASKENSKGYTHGLTGRYRPASVTPAMLSHYNEGWQLGRQILGVEYTFAMGRA